MNNSFVFTYTDVTESYAKMIFDEMSSKLVVEPQ